MWHSLETFRMDDGNKTQTHTLVFNNREVSDISLVKHDGITVSATVSFKSVNEDHEQSYLQFKTEHSDLHKHNVEMLEALSMALQAVQSYFEDEQGNIFPFDQVLYVSKATNTAVMAGNVKVVFDPQNEMPMFLDLYRNWMDLK